jgi:hypothetical protein
VSAHDDLSAATERLKIRAEMRSHGDQEDTGVIEREALSRAPKSESHPPRSKIALRVLDTLPPWGRVIVLLAIIGALGASGLIGSLLAKWAP